MSKLTGEQYKELIQAFISAFPTKTKLKKMLRLKLDKNLEAIVGDGSLEDMVFELIEEFETRDRILELIQAAREENPDNSKLEAFEKRIKEDTQGKQNDIFDSYKGLTLFGITQSVYEWVAGQATNQQLRKLHEIYGNKLIELEKGLYLLLEREVFTTENQREISDIEAIRTAVRSKLTALGEGYNMVVSTPTDTPQHMQIGFDGDLDEILEDDSIRPLLGDGIPDSYYQHRKKAPITFTKYRQEFVGLIKIGFLKSYFGVDFKPYKGGNQIKIVMPDEPKTKKGVYLPKSSVETKAFRFQEDQESVEELNSKQEPIKPVWADSIGGDEYGFYADLIFKGVKQRFRWIEPGDFWMGSPEDEKERYKNEIHHKVHISHGFWLGRTTCTQALWKVVMGENPSYFKGDDLPVERVSWNDVKDFIKRLNKAIKGLYFCLPTEAEWEYSCRAGTQTPFSFGETIDSEQVNFDGNYPYANSKKSIYRKKTVTVGSLPCNLWGLYEIHGNVWEWCEDRYGDYGVSNPNKMTVDPLGSDTGTLRVLRGGSWFNLAKDCHSAYRGYNDPDYRNFNIGFHLASGHQEKTG